ncbi:cytochrome c oxidase assembly protein [Mesorhizobium sp. CN2-181]|uniref:cytochrome c oxidase assembly protein n=1 Tax=Mesorhizobium yinganensis TaxID=3157707 RepID=UPI0032B77EE4
MAGATPTLDVRTQRSNRVVAAVCVAFFAGMVGAAYAAVPLYAMFCKLTGYGGTTQRVTQYSDRILDRQITVRFDANVSGGVPWDFQPVQRDVTMKIGETTEIAYQATNLFDRPSAGRATFNVTPELAGAYFNKVECFCFTDTTLNGGETLKMPVVFYVDPAIDDVPELKSMKTITLSYTLFPVEPAPAKAVDATGKTGKTADENIGG